MIRIILRSPGRGIYYTSRWYTGDSLLKKKIQLNLSMMGHAVDYDREFRLKAVVAEGTDGEVAKTFLEFESLVHLACRTIERHGGSVHVKSGCWVNYTMGLFSIQECNPHWNWEQRKRMNIKCY
ncbi:MAG: hypothetical protein V8R91_07225 [Butyricimonas faecihominis]